MAPFTEPVADCRFSNKVAVPVAGATEFCALERVDEARRANADCHFPTPRGDTAAKARAAPADDSAPWAPTGADERSAGAEAAAPAPGATWANVARDGANDDEGGRLVSPFSPRAPGVPTPVSHRDHPEEMDDGVKVPGIRKSKNGKPRHGKMDVTSARLWGRSLDACGTWLAHPCCRTCGCIHKRPHFSRGYCKPCYYRSPLVRERRFTQWVRHGRRLLADDADARWLRLLLSASRKRSADRKVGLDPDYSVIAYRATWKLFGERCACCGALDDLTIDHHWPASEGVPIEPGNAVLLCRACNASKGTRRPAEFYSPEQLAVIERTLMMAAEFTFLLEALRPELDLRRLRGRAA